MSDWPLPIIPETIDITDDEIEIIEIDVNPSSPISEDLSSDEDDDDGDNDDDDNDDGDDNEDNVDDDGIADADEDHVGDGAVDDDGTYGFQQQTFECICKTYNIVRSLVIIQVTVFF